MRKKAKAAHRWEMISLRRDTPPMSEHVYEMDKPLSRQSRCQALLKLLVHSPTPQMRITAAKELLKMACDNGGGK